MRAAHPVATNTHNIEMTNALKRRCFLGEGLYLAYRYPDDSAGALQGAARLGARLPHCGHISLSFGIGDPQLLQIIGSPFSGLCRTNTNKRK